MISNCVGNVAVHAAPGSGFFSFSIVPWKLGARTKSRGDLPLYATKASDISISLFQGRRGIACLIDGGLLGWFTSPGRVAPLEYVTEN
ncbi:MAG: hypothetical protein KAT58_08620 [candidate division Zixibacteria bacterium]|nr:hypothetical protein [candidate division Zixibacteria bacterium]